MNQRPPVPVAHVALLAIIYLSFVTLGLPDGVLGVAWTAMRVDLAQPLAAVGMVTVLYTLCAAACTFFSGHLIARLGTGPLVAGSCLLTGLALLGYAQAPSFLWLLLLTLPLGLGAGAVDSALNHFVSAHYSSRHMNWLHGCWGIGATTGPLILGAALATPAGWRGGYIGIAGLQLSMALVLWLTLSLWRNESATPAPDPTLVRPPEQQAVKPMALWLAPLTFFLYVSAEMGTGLWVASILVEGRSFSATRAGVWVFVFYGAITVGRFGIGLVANRLGNRRLIRWGICTAVAGALLFAMPNLPSDVGWIGLALMGLGCAPIYPSMMHETIHRFPPSVARTVIGRQVAFATIGTAFMPAMCGLLATVAGLGSVMPAIVFTLALLWLATERLNRLT